MNKKYIFFLFMNLFALNITCVIDQTELDRYNTWKSTKQEAWREADKTTIAAQADSLTATIEYWLNKVRRHREDSDAHHELLYAYNFLRELLKVDPITSAQDIDPTWLSNQSYSSWKEYRQELWIQDGKTTRTSHINSLLCDAKYWINHLKEDPEDTDIQREVLHRYNFLRELLDVPLAKHLLEVDQTWINQTAHTFHALETEKYNEWKENQFKAGNALTLARKVSSLASYTQQRLGCLQEICEAQTAVLYGYNFVRELLHLPLATSLSDIDRNWLNQVKEEAMRSRFMESQHCENPTNIQLYVIKNAQKLLKICHKVEALSDRNGDGHSNILVPGKHILSLGNLPNIDQLIAVTYHEFGHILYQDNEDRKAISLGKKTYEELLQDPSFKTPIERVDKYFELGKNAFDKSTPIGKHISDILSKYPMLQFWTPPDDEKELQKILYLQGVEKRADLFAIEKLFEHKLLSTVLSFIAGYAFGNSAIPIIAESHHDHPSDMERALYMTGFLVDKGVDINRHLKSGIPKVPVKEYHMTYWT